MTTKQIYFIGLGVLCCLWILHIYSLSYTTVQQSSQALTELAAQIALQMHSTSQQYLQNVYNSILQARYMLSLIEALQQYEREVTYSDNMYFGIKYYSQQTPIQQVRVQTDSFILETTMPFIMYCVSDVREPPNLLQTLRQFEKSRLCIGRILQIDSQFINVESQHRIRVQALREFNSSYTTKIAITYILDLTEAFTYLYIHQYRIIASQIIPATVSHSTIYTNQTFRQHIEHYIFGITHLTLVCPQGTRAYELTLQYINREIMLLHCLYSVICGLLVIVIRLLQRTAFVERQKVSLMQEEHSEVTKQYHTLQHVLDIVPIGIIMTNLSGNILSINHKITDILQYTDMDCVHLNIVDICQQQFFHRYAIFRNIQILRKDQSFCTVDIIMQPLYNSREQITAIIFCVIDATERQQKEYELVRLRTAIETLHVGITITDIHGDIVYVNAADTRMHEYTSKDEILGQKSNIFAPEYLRKQDFRANGKHAEFPNWRRETVNITQSGREFPVEIISNPIYNEQKQFDGRVAACTDITARLAAKTVLQNNEERFRAIFENDLVSILVLTSTCAIVQCNHTALRMTGYTMQDMLAHTLLNMTFIEDQSQCERQLRQTFNIGHGFIHEQRFVKKDGTLFWGQIAVSPIYNITKEIIAVSVLIHDITKRKAYEYDLLNRSNEYRQLYTFVRSLCDNVPDMIWAVDEHYNYTFTNIATCREVLHLDNTSTAIGKPTTTFAVVENDLSHKLQQANVKAYQEHRAQRMIETVTNDQTQNGQTMYVDMYTAPLYDEQGTCIGVVGSARNITQERQLDRKRTEIEQKLRESEYRMRQAITHAPFPMCIFTETGQVIHISNTFLTICKKTEYQVQTLSDIHESLTILTEPIHVNALYQAGTQRYNGEFSIDNFILDLYTVPLGIFTESRLILGMAFDITSQKDIQQHLISKRDLLQTLIDNVPDCIYVKDRQHRFTIVNRAVLQAFNVTTYIDVIGKTDYDFFEPHIADSFHIEEEHLFETGIPLVNKEEIVPDCLTGETKWQLVSAVPMYRQQEITHLIGINRDITQYRQLSHEYDNLKDMYKVLTQQISAFLENVNTSHIDM